MRLGIREIYEAARAAGFTPDQATTWTAIALAESGGETGAHHSSGEDSWGLWQINVAPEVRANAWGDLSDPVVNARAAYDISRRGTDMRPWPATHSSRAGTATDYRTHLDEVSAVTGYAGDPRGVEGYRAPLRPALPPSGPDPTPDVSTAPPIDHVDSDDDGLEILYGDDPLSSGADPSDAFVDAALAQCGDRYVFGAEVGLDDPDPDAFDFSELIQWAAHQAGLTIPDGAMYQYLDLRQKGQLSSVDEALSTRGALLSYFSSEPTPGGGRPARSHVAISLGDGRTIEARGRRYGVGEFGGAGRFNRAGILTAPGYPG